MRKINIPLIVGLIIVLGVLVLIFFGEYFAPYDASYGETSGWFMNDKGEKVFRRAPFPPDKNHIFGTDNGGRDVLSVIMAGAKNTFMIVFIATFLRFLIATPIAFFAAFGEGISKRLITIFSSTFSAVPSLLICIMILKIDAIKNLELIPSIIAFIIVFTIVGWGRLASTIEDKIKDILNQDFIQGAIAAGKSKFAIATQNVSVHIMPSMIIYLFLEIALVLLLLAQLGIFEVFVGNKQVFVVKTVGSISRSNFNYFPEWGAMLASTKRSVTGNMFWISAFPLLVFSVSIIGFNLLGEGLNFELNKRNSRFISYVNKFWFHLSPLTYISEIMHFKEKRKNVIVKTLTIVVIVLLIVVPVLNALLILDNGVMGHVMEVDNDIYQGRLIGSTGHEEFGNYIIDKLKSYNIKPLFNGGYISEFTINPTINIINDSKFTILNEKDEIIDDLKYKVDYYLESWYSNSIDRLEGEIITVDTYLSKEYTPSKNYILLLNPNGSQNAIYDKLVNERKEHKHIKGVIVPDIKYSTFIQKRNDLDEKGLTRVLDNVQAYNETAPPIKINVGKIAAMKLWKLEGSKVLINSFIDNQEGLVGKNIGGIIQGKNQENPIIIATTYDYLGFHDLGTTTGVEDFTKYKGLYENGTSIAGSLEIAKNLGNIKQTPERSIIFMFIDGSKITIEGFLDIEKQGILDEQPLLILLRFMGINKWGRTEDSLYYNTIVNSNIGLEQDFHKWLRRNSSKDYFIIGDNQISERNLLVLSDKDMVGIVLQGIKEKERGLHYGMVQSNLEEIDTDRLTAHIQYLLDSIIDMVYGKIWLK